MKRVLMAMLIAGLMICSGCKNPNSTAVITVNDSPITKQEIEENVNKQMSSPFLAQLNKSSNDYKIMRLVATDKVINELIVKKIIADEIAKRNINVSQEELDSHKAKMVQEIGGEDNLKQLLEQNHLDENEFNSLIADEIQITKLIASISPVKIADNDVKKFYNDNKVSKFTYPDTVKASHILIKDKAKAQEILQKAKAEKADFAALAKQYSEDPGSGKKGGDLGYFTKDQMVKPFADAAFALKPDTISDLVQSEFGYHIIKVFDRKKAGVTPFNEVKNEIKKFLEDEKKVEILQKFIEGQKSQTSIVYNDKNFSPEGIKEAIQKLTSNAKEVAPMPTQIPQTEKEAE